MPAKTHLFLCLKDNFGVLLHDPASGATAMIQNTFVPSAAESTGNKNNETVELARISG